MPPFLFRHVVICTSYTCYCYLCRFDVEDRTIHTCLNASSGVIRFSGSHCRHLSTKSIKFSSDDLSACASGLEPGRRFLPFELGTIRGLPLESIYRNSKHMFISLSQVQPVSYQRITFAASSFRLMLCRVCLGSP